MNQLDHVTAVIAVIVCEVIEKLIAKLEFSYLRDLSFLLSLHLFHTENAIELFIFE